MGSCLIAACSGPNEEDGGNKDGVVEGGPQTLSVSLVPVDRSTNPRARQSVWFLHFVALDSTLENVPLVQGLQRTSSVWVPRFFTRVPGGQREWGLHPPSAPLGEKLLGGHAQTRSWVVVQGSFSVKPTGQGARQRWHCWTPFSPRVKVPSGQGVHSLTDDGEQWVDT